MTNKVKLHVGYIGKTRKGKRVEIVRGDDIDPCYLGSDGIWRYNTGNANINKPGLDIIGPWTEDKPEYETGVWYGWNGGECPVHPKTVVDWLHVSKYGATGPAGVYEWSKADSGIAAFRIVTPYVEPRRPHEIFIDTSIKQNWCFTHKHNPNAVLFREVIEADDQ